ncbi:MAG: ribokinase [Epulopiscium sp. Nuni2H_MBin003]|nr:MAG: ribokinase [Epulopiscium sp. Nuni2H_MBin003]
MILVIGSLNIDTVIRVAQFPQSGETIIGKSLLNTHGGKGANQACAVGKLGADIKMLGCVGMDSFGDEQLNQLQAYGVDVSSIKRTKTEPTGNAIICVNDSGNNNIIVIQGANKECSVEYLKEHDDDINNCEYVILQMEIPHDAIEYAVKRAKELNKIVILNPAPAPEQMSEQIYKYVDYLTPNETELATLTGDPVAKNKNEIIKSAKKLLAKGVKNVIVTLGDKGALWVNAVDTIMCIASTVDAVDTTAAGDCFNGAFVVALSEGKSIMGAMKFANKAASISVTRRGAQISIPIRTEVDNCL